MNTKHSHIIEVSEILIDRLSWVKIKPEYLLYSLDSSVNHKIEKMLKKIYPESFLYHEKIDGEQKANLIFGIIDCSPNDFFEIIPTLVSDWKKNLKAGGLLMLGILDVPVNIPDLGDFFIQVGFEDVVIDKEILYDEAEVVCVSVWAPRVINVPLNAIRRPT